MMNKKIKTSVTAVSMIGVLMIGSAMAYFADGDTTTNTFTVGKVSMDLRTPNWDPSDVTMITPQEEFAQDPQIVNDGINDLFAFIEVTVPYADVKTANENGTVNSAKDTQLFTWDVNNGWTQVGNVIENSAAQTYTYVYGYTNVDASAMEPLAAGATTPALYDYVRFANVIEDEGLEETELDIIINGYAIQTLNLNDNDNDVDGENDDGRRSPADVWAVVSNQAPSTAMGSENANTDAKN